MYIEGAAVRAGGLFRSITAARLHSARALSDCAAAHILQVLGVEGNDKEQQAARIGSHVTCEGECSIQIGISGGQSGVGVVAALVIVVLDVEAAQL